MHKSHLLCGYSKAVLIKQGTGYPSCASSYLWMFCGPLVQFLSPWDFVGSKREMSPNRPHQRTNPPAAADAAGARRHTLLGLWMRKQGYRESTIQSSVQALKAVARRANLLDPESTKAYRAGVSLMDANPSVSYFLFVVAIEYLSNYVQKGSGNRERFVQFVVKYLDPALNAEK